MGLSDVLHDAPIIDLVGGESVLFLHPERSLDVLEEIPEFDPPRAQNVAEIRMGVRENADLETRV